MTLISNYLVIYLSIGIVCSLCFDILYQKLKMEQTSKFERLTWFLVWPLFLTVFLYAIYNNTDDEIEDEDNAWINDPEVQDFLERADEPGPCAEEDDKVHTVGGLTNDKEGRFMKFQQKQEEYDTYVDRHELGSQLKTPPEEEINPEDD